MYFTGDGWFEPLFFHVFQSRYEDKWILVSDIDQATACGRKMDDDPDYMHFVEDTLMEREGHVLFDRNPCHHPDFGFTGIHQGRIFFMLLSL